MNNTDKMIEETQVLIKMLTFFSGAFQELVNRKQPFTFEEWLDQLWDPVFNRFNYWFSNKPQVIRTLDNPVFDIFMVQAFERALLEVRRMCDQCPSYSETSRPHHPADNWIRGVLCIHLQRRNSMGFDGGVCTPKQTINFINTLGEIVSQDERLHHFLQQLGRYLHPENPRAAELWELDMLGEITKREVETLS